MACTMITVAQLINPYIPGQHSLRPVMHDLSTIIGRYCSSLILHLLVRVLYMLSRRSETNCSLYVVLKRR